VLMLVGLILRAPLCTAEELNAIPEFTGHVVDTIGLLKSDQRQTLEQTLAQYQSTKGSQIAVLIVDSTAPEAIEAYAMRVAEMWKIGRKGTDDGVLLLIARKDRSMRIEVGYGLEGSLSDIVSKRIIEDIIVPHFKAGDFNRGIVDGVAAILRVVDGEKLPPPTAQTNPNSAINAILISIFFGVLLGNRSSSKRLGIFGAGAIGFLAGLLMISFWGGVALGIFAAFAASLLLLSNDIGSGGGRGGLIHGGSRGWGGGFSGGFSGGGGGGFGGGGASGRW